MLLLLDYFKTFQVYSSFKGGCKINKFGTISKLFKFTVHYTNSLYNNWTNADFKTFQVYSSLYIIEKVFK